MKTLTTILVSALISGSALYAKPPHAEENGKGKKEKSQKKKHKKADKGFSRADQYTVQSYYRNLPPGLAKKYQRTGKLPPGWASKVNPGKTLPYSYRTELQPVPKELERSIEPGPIGTEVRRIGDKIIRLEKATNMILDVFEL